MSRVTISSIESITNKILTVCGVPDDQAAIITDTIIYAHQRGRHTHGLNRLQIYVRKIKEGLLTADTDLLPVNDLGSVVVYDACNGFGQVAAYEALNECMDRARKYGIGAVGVRNTNNFGTAGYFGEMATKEGLIGIVMGNAAPAIAPPGGNKPILGTNPICFAFPSPLTEFPIVLDMATTNAARGKIRLALRNGEKIPFGWAVDKNGKPTDDPAEALEGSLMPMGGYKGFGLSMVIDILAGLLTGSAFGGDVKNLNHPDGVSRNGNLFIVISPSFFSTQDEFESRMKTLIDRLKSCGDDGKVTLPGEIEYRSFLNNINSIELKDTQIDDTNKLAASLGINDELVIEEDGKGTGSV